jgi:ATP-dependent helicase HrpB
VLTRAWQYGERRGFNMERCRRVGIHAQAARQVRPLFEQFLRIAADEGLDTSQKPASAEALQRCVLVGFSDHLAKRLEPGSQRCRLVHGRRGTLARESAVKAPLFVVSEVREVESTAGGRDRNLSVVLNLATAIKEEWLRELFPHDFKDVTALAYDPALRRVVAREEKRFRDLVLEEKIADKFPIDEAARILAREVAAGRLVLENWNESVEQWIVRVKRLREWMPELELPAFADEDRSMMIEHVCHGALSYNEIKERPVLPIVKSRLSYQQQAWIDQYAPERIHLPKGRMAKVVFSADGPPTIAARIQDLYGVEDAIWIAKDRVRIRIQVLAPSNRPVQVTDDLSAFWRETYPKLKQQLQRRYPKHEWR